MVDPKLGYNNDNDEIEEEKEEYISN